MYYAGLSIDRAADRREDPDWVNALRAAADTTVLPMWRDRCLVSAAGPVRATGAVAGVLSSGGYPLVFLGTVGGAGCFAVDLSGLDEAEALRLVGADRSVDARSLVPDLEEAGAGALAYARGLLHWHRNQRFCGVCGTATAPSASGHQRTCPACERPLFPRIEPAVIVLVELPADGAHPRRCLLGRPTGADPERFSTVAGFVEVGESLEDAVAREVWEETGLKVRDVTYVASQPWPFPYSMMMGFRALAEAEDIVVDTDELEDAQWFTAAEIATFGEWEDDSATFRRPRRDSIARVLLDKWVAEEAAAR